MKYKLESVKLPSTAIGPTAEFDFDAPNDPDKLLIRVYKMLGDVGAKMVVGDLKDFLNEVNSSNLPGYELVGIDRDYPRGHLKKKKYRWIWFLSAVK